MVGAKRIIEKAQESLRKTRQYLAGLTVPGLLKVALMLIILHLVFCLFRPLPIYIIHKNAGALAAARAPVTVRRSATRTQRRPAVVRKRSTRPRKAPTLPPRKTTPRT